MRPSSLRLVAPAELPHVWQVGKLAAGEENIATGHVALDAQLPGAGWPLGTMVEVLQERSEQHVWQLLLPGLVQAVTEKPGHVVLVNAPFEPFAPSLSAQGLTGERLMCVRADKPPARLWASEQALRCADVVAVMAWLPRAKSADLRRLHMAAQQGGKLLFVFRELSAQNESSPARLRLMVEGSQELKVHILKRRGPPLQTPVVLPVHGERLSALLASRKRPAPVTPPAPAPVTALHEHRRSHVLDRAAALT